MVWVTLHAWYNEWSLDTPWSDLTIVETKTMQQTLEANAATEAKAATLADALQESGHVAIYGITFDFNKATLRPEAAPVLGQVQALLQGDAKLSIEIDGHTDSIGRPADQKLSADRAAAVKAWLVAHGIDAAPCHCGLRRHLACRGQRDRRGREAASNWCGNNQRVSAKNAASSGRARQSGLLGQSFVRVEKSRP